MSIIRPAKPGAVDLAAILRREILSGVRLHQERLPSERELAQGFGVARGTVREALNTLAAGGYLEIRPGSGAYVTFQPETQTNAAVANARPLELIDARFALEPHICRLAVLHARGSDLERAEDVLQMMEGSVEDPQRFAQFDKVFHAHLAEITGNSLLIWVMGQINSVRNSDQWEQMGSITLGEASITAYNTQHRQILNAIRTREAERAASLMKEHLETARLSLTRALET